MARKSLKRVNPITHMILISLIVFWMIEQFNDILQTSSWRTCILNVTNRDLIRMIWQNNGTLQGCIHHPHFWRIHNNAIRNKNPKEDNKRMETGMLLERRKYDVGPTESAKGFQPIRSCWICNCKAHPWWTSTKVVGQQHNEMLIIGLAKNLILKKNVWVLSTIITAVTEALQLN